MSRYYKPAKKSLAHLRGKKMNFTAKISKLVELTKKVDVPIHFEF